MRRLAVAVTVLFACACSRDLAVPLSRTLSVSPSFAAVAPRERLTLVASAGAGGYSFAFAPGSPLSGPGASIDPRTGAYQAGSGGSAQDLVDVTDAAGATVRITVSVGAPLRIAPRLAGTAPGGIVTFSASGGKPPYAFFVPEGASTVGASSGVYTASAAGDAVDRVVVRDATGDDLARDEAEVRVGRALSLYRASVGAVAPLEVVDVVALGGQPPYRYALASAPSGGGIDPASGRYTAGAAGDVSDVIRATDANGEHADLPVRVGPALSLRLLTPDPRPGVATRLVATGGKPPYGFGHGLHGNRSRGTVDSISGTYVPGPVPGASDLLEVRDAAGARASLPAPAIVGPFQAGTGAGIYACVDGDFDGDGRADLAFVASDHFSTFGLSRLTGAATERVAALPHGGEPFAVDLDRDGRTDLLFASGGVLTSLLADAYGGFHAGPSQGGAASRVAVRPDLDGYLTDGACTVGLDPGILEVALPVLGASIAPTCRALSTGGTVVGLASGRFSSGATVSWLVAEAPDRVFLATDLSPTPVEVPLPAGRTHRGGQRDVLARLPSSLWSEPDAVGLLADAPGGRTEFVVVVGTVAVAFDPTTLDSAWQGGPPVAGFRAAYARDLPVVAWDVAAWNGVDGRVLTFRVGASGAAAATRRLAGDFAFPVACAALADLNGDLLPDLAVAGPGSRTADVLLGSPGAFGAQVHFPRTGEAGAFVDVDGDGLADWLEALPGGRGLRTSFGGGGQLAQGSEALLSQAIVSLAAGPIPGGGAAVMFQDASLRLHALEVDAGGTPGVPVALAITGPGGAPWTPPAILEAGESMSGDTGGFTLVDAGGAVRGGDAFYRERPETGSRIGHLVIRGAGASALHVATPETPLANGCRLELLSGTDGRVAQAVAACESPDGLVVSSWRSAFTPGPTPAFGPWIALPDVSFDDGTGVTIRAALRGMRPWAAFVVVDAVAGVTPRTTVLGYGASGGASRAEVPATAGWYAAGDLDADGVAELLLVDTGGAARILHPGGGAFSAGPPFSLAAPQGELVPLATPGLADLAAGGADLLVYPGGGPGGFR